MPTTGSIVRGNGPRGGFPDFVVKKLHRDKLDILSGTVLRHYKVGAANQRIDPSWVDRYLAPDPGWGIPCVDADADVRDGICTVTYVFEGQSGTTNEDAVTYELETTMGSKSIKTHPAFANLKAKYGWDDEAGCFAEFMPGNDAGNTAGFDAKDQKNKRSPLAGVSDWFFVGVTYRISYCAQSVPQSLLAAIGTIISRPRQIGQFNLPAASKKRNWLVMGPKVERVGNATKISEEYQLGEPGGFQKEIYGAGQLGEAGGDNNSGLTSSGL